MYRRHVDCSSQCGNEKEVGAALAEVFSDWLVDRPDVFVTSKVWPTGDDMPIGLEIEQACKDTLSALKLEYLDLYLLPADHHCKALQVCAQT